MEVRPDESLLFHVVKLFQILSESGSRCVVLGSSVVLVFFHLHALLSLGFEVFIVLGNEILRILLNFFILILVFHLLVLIVAILMLFLILLEHAALLDLRLSPLDLLFIELLHIVLFLGLLFLHWHILSICISILVLDLFFVLFVLDIIRGESALNLLRLIVEDVLSCSLVILHVLILLLRLRLILVRFRHLRLLNLLLFGVFFDLVSLLILLLLLLLLLALLELLAQLKQ